MMIWSVFLWLWCGAALGAIDDASFTHAVSLPTDTGTLSLMWALDDARARLRVRLRVTIDASAGYVGIGFCDAAGAQGDSALFPQLCDYWVGSVDPSTGRAVCGDLHDETARRHDAASVRREVAAQDQLLDCDATVANGVLDVAFSRPYGNPDASCTYRHASSNKTLPCDRVVAFGANQSVLLAFHTSEPCLVGACTGQHASSVALSLDWKASHLRPVVAAPTPAPPSRRFVTPRAAPQLRAANPAQANQSFFEASWAFNGTTQLLTIEMFAPTAGWLAIGFRAADNARAQAHVATRLFVGWLDDATGNPRLIDALSSSNASAPVPRAPSDSAVVADSVQASVLQGGTAMRFTVRAANWSDGADVGAARLLLPIGRAPLVQWAVGAVDGAAALGGLCGGVPAFGASTGHRFCYAPHARSLAQRGVATDLVVLPGGTARRDDEGSFEAAPASLFQVTWRKLNATAFRFRMQATTSGYVSIGWRRDAAPDGWHKQSDMLVGWIDASGQPQLVDTWSDNLLQPRSDDRQDAVLVGGSEAGGVTTIEFDRLADSGDAAHDVPLRDASVLLQWGTSPKKPTAGAARTGCDDAAVCFVKHASKQQVGSGVVNFFRIGSVAAPVASELDAITWADWFAIFTGICLALAIVARLLHRCCCLGAGAAPAAAGGVDVDGDSVRVEAQAPPTAAAAAATAELATSGYASLSSSKISAAQLTNYARIVASSSGSVAALASQSGDVGGVDDDGAARSTLDPRRAANQMYVKLTAEEQLQSVSLRLELPALPISYMRGNEVVFNEQQADPWGYNEDEHGVQVRDAPAALASENRDYGIIPQFRSGDADDSASAHPSRSSVAMPKQASAALADAITQMAPLSLAVKPTLGQRALALFHRRLRGEASVGDGLLALLYLLLHVAAAATKAPVTLLDWANLFGYLGAANALMVALPATRNSALNALLGTAFDRTIMFHRWIGRWIFLLILVHAVLYLPTYLPDSFDTLTAGEQGLENLWGVIAAAASLLLLLSSLNAIRRRHFETFFWLHYFYVVFYVFLALHSPVIGFRFTMIAVAFFVLDRLVRLFWGLFPRRTASLDIKDQNMICVQMPRHPLARYRVGSYVFVNFMGLSLTQWHPFTLSSGPNDDLLEIHIKGLGDHTMRLIERARSRNAANSYFWVRIDGPYGFIPLEYNRYPYLLLVGAGVGVTPCIAALKDIYRVRMSEAARQKVPYRCAAQIVHLAWSCASPSHLSWFVDVLQACVGKATQADSKYPALTIDVYMSSAIDTCGRLRWDAAAHPDIVDGAVLHGGIKIHMGRVDPRATMARVVKRMKKKQIGSGMTVACGQALLVEAFWDEAVQATLSGEVVMKAHFERFDW
jgi:predicted ferric reductase